MGNDYLRKRSKSGHVGARVILSTFRTELGVVINRIIMSIRVYIYRFAYLLTSFGALGIDLS